MILLWCCQSVVVRAYETDQYSTATLTQADSIEKMDALVNAALQQVVQNWDMPRDDYRLLSRVGGFFHSRQLEKWINDSGQVEVAGNHHNSIFRSINWESSPIVRWKGLAATLTVNKTQLGADKLSHFFGVGWMYWKADWQHRAQWDEVTRREHVANLGLETENGLWGRLTTNVFSNADLVANWEGYLFYRSILEDNVVEGKRALISWQGDRPVLQRVFSFRDHVSEFWNEAQLPNDYDVFLADEVRMELRRFCSRFTEKDILNYWTTPRFEWLWHHYRHLHLEQRALKYRLDHVCKEYRAAGGVVLATNDATATPEGVAPVRQTLDHLTGDLSVITPRMRSPLQQCNVILEKAINEHLYLMQIHESVGKYVQSLLEQAPFPKVAAEEPLLAEQKKIVRRFVQWIDPQKKSIRLSKKQMNNLIRFRAAATLSLPSLQMPVRIDMVFSGRESTKQCVVVPVNIESLTRATRSGELRLSLYYCRYADRADNKAQSFWRVSTTDRMLRSSMESYFAMADREGYVYRTIPKHCKWY